MRENEFLGIDYSRYNNNSSSYVNQLTDEVIANGLEKYLRKYYTAWSGKWSGIDTTGRFTIQHDFFQTAQIKPSRFFEIFKDDDRRTKFIDLLKGYNVKASLKYGMLTLIDLEHPHNK